MPRLPHHRRLAHAATLLALVMAALAPGISQALARLQGVRAPWTLVCSVDRSVPRGSLPADGRTSVFDHCPYCALAGDLPVLPPSPLAGLPRAGGADARPAMPLQRPGTAPRWQGAQPRAPPRAA